LRHTVLYAASAFFLLQSMDALGIIDRSIYGQWYGKTGDKITVTLNLVSILTSLFLFWSSIKMGMTRINRVLPMAAASLLLISILWSVNPALTLTRGTAYFFVVLGAIGLAEVLDKDKSMYLLAFLCGLSAVASVAQLLIFPEPGDFRGIFAQKNVLGQAMAAGVLAALYCAWTTDRRRFRYICVIALCTFVAFMSKSATSILTIFLFFVLDLLGGLYLKGGYIRILSLHLAIGSLLIGIFLFAIFDTDFIFSLFGKDPTLSGRTLFWTYVIENISKRPVLGWGFSAFWSPVNPIALQIAEAIKGDNWNTFIIPNAHNGILELLLDIGFLGTSFFVFLWMRNFVMAVKCMNCPPGRFGLSTVLLLVGILLIGVSEDVLLTPGQIWTNLFFVMGFICEKELWLARAARRHGRPRPRSMRAANAI
jgi:O-antigen ligase